jgi:hypothetical protein
MVEWEEKHKGPTSIVADSSRMTQLNVTSFCFASVSSTLSKLLLIYELNFQTAQRCGLI